MTLTSSPAKVFLRSMISQKAKYALRALVALARATSSEPLVISDIAVAHRIPKKFLEQILLDLKYGPNRERSIAGLRRISKPGLRVYSQSSRVPRVLGGLGVAVLSTSQGLMTDREARKRNVGGEVLCYVW